LPSVTVTVLTPDVCPVTTEAVPPLDQVYVYAPDPPLAVTVAEPLLPPLHETFTTAVELTNEEGCVIVTVFVEVQPEASVTVTVLTPAFRPVITDVVAPLDHK
jgi:hypothetical protein